MSTISSDDCLRRVIAAWEATKPGDTTVREIQRWLIEDMKPAIDEARELLSRRESLPIEDGEGWQSLSCDDQFELARKIASNVGYVLVPEQSIQDAEDSAPVPDFYAPTNRLHALGTDLGNVPLIKRAPSTEHDHLWTPLYLHPSPSNPGTSKVEKQPLDVRV
jgi:hypothetical protein